MSLFSRIAGIIRANLNFRRDDVDIDDSVYEEIRDSQREYQRQKQQRNDAIHHRNDDPLAKHYANLEVPYGSDLETVTKSWKALLRKYHPDIHSGDPEKQKIANQLVQELNQSYNELKKKLR